MGDTAQMRARQQELAHLIASMAPEDGDFHVADDIRIFRRSSPTALHHGESSISFCAIGQGTKHVEVGEHQYDYGPDDILLTTIELPMMSHVVQASEESPYLSMSLDLNPALVRSVVVASGLPESPIEQDLLAFKVAPMQENLLDATVRLMRTVVHKDESTFLAPMIRQEIIFRLLRTGHSGRMRQIAGMNPVSNQVQIALEHMREQFNQPLRVADIARGAGMSASSFHEHFKRVTGFTPLQYQKHLRLREARRLLVSENIDAAEAAYAVGYGDASHFNRDYKRMFGEPPARDLQRMREAGELTPIGR